MIVCPRHFFSSRNRLRRNRRSSRVAFTLVELVLAATISAVMLVEVAAMFYFASNQHRGAMGRLATEARIDRSLAAMADDLRCVAASADINVRSFAAAKVDLSATGSRFIFRCRRPDSIFPHSAASVVDWFLYDDDGDLLLVRRSDPVDDIPTAAGSSALASAAEPSYQIALRHVKDFEIEYIDSAGASYDSWPSAFAPRLPVMVNISITADQLADGSGHQAESFISVRLLGGGGS